MGMSVSSKGMRRATWLMAALGALLLARAADAQIYVYKDQFGRTYFTDAPPHEIAKCGVAMVPGGQGVFPSLTVRENLKVAQWMDRRSDRAKERYARVLEIFPVLDGRTFLDLKVADARRVGEAYGAEVPIAIMTSPLTHQYIADHLARAGARGVRRLALIRTRPGRRR